MKKNIIVSIVFFLSLTSYSQISDHAIGLRGGSGNHGNGGEITYQHGLGDANRLELDLGWRGNNGNNNNYQHVAITGIYQWWWNIEGGFNWYVGPGAQLGSYQDKNNSSSDGVTLGIGGQIGVEFDFNTLDVPLLLSLDTRPMFGFIGGTSGFGYGGAFALRYTF